MPHLIYLGISKSSGGATRTIVAVLQVVAVAVDISLDIGTVKSVN